MTNDYVSTPSLPDDKGKALLDELSSLHSAIDFDPETNRKVRIGSNARHWAIAALKAALIKAAANFEHHREFGAWLNNNWRPDIEAWDPVLDRVELTDKIRDLEWRMDRLQESNRDLDKLLKEIMNHYLSQFSKAKDEAAFRAIERAVVDG